ncbi:uncharacterized protein LOC143352530 isoform X2 [Halictus rubicundus]
MPQNNAVAGQQSSTSPPLIQFTDGGIRVNFAGFHAQAGLGGLLGGSQAGGGLHASAGTPWGANAAAGLGGALDGNNPTARGGLYARASFSDGGPSAGAGLGGVLGGNGSDPIRGGLYAGASTGSQSANTEPSTNAGSPGRANPNPPRGRSNIQIISRKKVTSQQQSRESTGKADSSAEKDPPTVTMVRNTNTPDVAPASAAGKASVSASNTAEVGAPPPDPLAAVSQVAGKVKTIGKTLSVEPVPVVPALPDKVENVVPAVFTKEVTVLHPKRVFRKRFWTPRKQIIYSIPAEVQEPEAAHTQNIARRQTQGSLFSTYLPGSRQQEQKPSQNDGFYDDIFNIPVSTLNAVNRLLNNNAG